MSDPASELTCLILLALWLPVSIFSSLVIAYVLHKIDLDNDDKRRP